jgi:Icc-related predicted phosphoesterase
MGYQLVKQSMCNATYLDNDVCEIHGLKIYGTPYSKTYGRWSFMKSEEDLDREWAKIPEGIDILVVHTPPFGVLDLVEGAGHVGSVTLADHIFNRVKPKLVVCGHLHLNGAKTEQKNGITFVNAAMLDEDYILTRKPVTVVL